MSCTPHKTVALRFGKAEACSKNSLTDVTNLSQHLRIKLRLSSFELVMRDELGQIKLKAGTNHWCHLEISRHCSAEICLRLRLRSNHLRIDDSHGADNCQEARSASTVGEDQF